MKKKHHAPDYVKNKDADVIMHGWEPAIKQDHSVKEVGSSVFPKYEDNSHGAFLAGNGRVRPQPHKMINECDH